MSELINEGNNTPHATEQAPATEAAPQQTAPTFDPFDDRFRIERTETTNDEQPETPIAETNAEHHPEVTTTETPETPPAEEPEETVDAIEWLKSNLGYDDIETAKREIQELKDLKEKAKTPEEIKFANEASQKFFDALKEGKEDEVFNYLAEKRKIEHAEKLDPSNVKDAAEILKLHLQYKHKDLEADEIEYLFNKKFNIPEKPEQQDIETDDEYQVTLARWEKEVRLAQKELTIEAKLVKPELSNYKSQLVLPDIPKKETQEPTQQGPSQEELAAMQKAREDYLQSLPKSLQEFSGFTTTAKDTEVEIPVAYGVTDAEKKQLQKDLENFDPTQFLADRWLTKEGSLDIKKLAADFYLLNNQERILQKVANEAAAKRLSHHIKTKSNIQIGSPAPQGNPQLGKQQIQRSGNVIVPTASMAETFFK